MDKQKQNLKRLIDESRRDSHIMRLLQQTVAAWTPSMDSPILPFPTVNPTLRCVRETVRIGNQVARLVAARQEVQAHAHRWRTSKPRFCSSGTFWQVRLSFSSKS